MNQDFSAGQPPHIENNDPKVENPVEGKAVGATQRSAFSVQPSKRLLLCDFDGTITLKDVTNLIIDHYTTTDWRETVLPRFWRGEIDHLQVMVEIYAPLKVAETELIDYSLKVTQIRPGFKELYDFCKQADIDLVVVSGGMDFYIKPFLLDGMPYFSYTGELGESGWSVRRPAVPAVVDGQDFKVQVMEELKSRQAYSEVIFCGDGRNDFPLAQHADTVFSVEGSRLSQLCTESNVPYTNFSDFFQVIAQINQI
jgi:2-hydroxy-3-keto-5-methylthiopentenyl-1-phosphate phosphatase